MKPALWGTRNDFLADARVERDRADGFDTRLVNVTTGIRHRFSDTFNIQAGVEFERGQTKDAVRKRDYRLVGLPLTLSFDSSDNRLEPTEGWRINAGVTPYLGALGSSLNMVQTRFDAATYFALDDRARYILAARVGFGSLVGAELENIPANRRFFAGGGSSVRGYAFRSLSPMRAGRPIGGRSLIEGSLEARIRITDTIGIVPFIDAGGAFRESYPDFGERLRFAAGTLDAEGLLASARGATGPDAAGWLTRAHGQLGIRAEREGDAEAALRHFDACLETGAIHTREYLWALDARRRLAGSGG